MKRLRSALRRKGCRRENESPPPRWGRVDGAGRAQTREVVWTAAEREGDPPSLPQEPRR